MSRNINVRINDAQDDKIRKSGMTASKFTRLAIDDFSPAKHNALILHDIAVLQKGIDVLVGLQDELRSGLIEDTYTPLYKLGENVKKTEREPLYKNEENVKKLYEEEENSLQNSLQPEEQPLYKNGENVKTMEEDPHYPQMKKHLETLSKMLNIHGTIPKYTKTMISEETTFSTNEVSDFIVLYREDIKQIPYNIDKELHDAKLGEKRYKA